VSLDFSWLDLVLALLLGAAIALGMKRGLIGLVSSLVIALLWVVANIVGGFYPLFGFVVALALGAFATFISRNLLSDVANSLNDVFNQAAGGVGGFLVGVCLVSALVMSFPMSLNQVSGRFNYPSASLPSWAIDAISRSATYRWLAPPKGWSVWQDKGAIRALLIPDLK
jgi:hypothetical protein